MLRMCVHHSSANRYVVTSHQVSDTSASRRRRRPLSLWQFCGSLAIITRLRAVGPTSAVPVTGWLESHLLLIWAPLWRTVATMDTMHINMVAETFEPISLLDHTPPPAASPPLPPPTVPLNALMRWCGDRATALHATCHTATAGVRVCVCFMCSHSRRAYHTRTRKCARTHTYIFYIPFASNSHYSVRPPTSAEIKS